MPPWTWGVACFYRFEGPRQVLTSLDSDSEGQCQAALLDTLGHGSVQALDVAHYRSQATLGEGKADSRPAAS